MTVPHIYKNAATEIRFSHTLHVEIYTPRLYIRSTQPSDIDSYAALYGDPEVMAKILDGQTKSREFISDRIKNVFAKRWQSSDPYSGLAVFHRDTNEFLGHISFSHGDHPGEAEISYLFKKEYWNQGYATEAVQAIVKDFAPATLREGYLLQGTPLRRIVATARTDNPYSSRILQRLGMQLLETKEKFGALRHHYSLDMADLLKSSSQKTTNLFIKQTSERNAA